MFELFTDDQRAAILRWLSNKKREGYTLDMVIEEFELGDLWDLVS